MTDKEIINVVLAHDDGEQIQYRCHGDDTWKDCTCNQPTWNFTCNDYRVKPSVKCEYLLDNGNCDLEELEWGFPYPCGGKCCRCPDYKPKKEE